MDHPFMETATQTLTLNRLLATVVQLNASDLHIAVGYHPSFRVDGALKPAKTVPRLTEADVSRMAREILSQDQWETLLRDRELDFSFSTRTGQGRTARFRGNCYFTMGSLAMALRMINPSILLPRELHLPMALEDVCQMRRGLFLVTGPTGHGKSTTLAAMIQQINVTRCEHIVTIEDPIEYMFASEASIIHQREVGSDTRSFAEALRRVLREDPDVIMIGEMRDLETISAAITAAETGHLVFATLHTPDAPQSIDRIVDAFTASQQNQVRLQLSNILIGICSQQLIPMVGGGRVVATELLMANPAIRNCIREGKTGQITTTMQTSRQSGMHTMDQDLVRLVKENKLDYGNAQRFAYNAREFESLFMM